MTGVEYLSANIPMTKIRFGVVGAGLWGKAHAEVYSTHHLSALTAVCDIDEEKARALAGAYGASSIHTSYENLARDPLVDAIAVVTPDFAHCGPIVAAAKAGKPVIVEKPLAMTLEDLSTIEEAVSRSGIALMVDFHNRWSPPIAVARNDIAAGRLGRLVSAYVRLNDTIDVPTQMLSWARRSSILWFLGSHSVDTLRFLSGDEVERVYTVARSGVLESFGIKVADIYQSILEFRSGLIATTENSWILPNTNPSVNDHKISILGSKGMFNLDLTHNQLMERYLEQTADRPDCLVKPLVHGRHLGFASESIRNCVERLASGAPMLATLEDGIRVTKVILAMMESASRRETISVKY